MKTTDGLYDLITEMEKENEQLRAINAELLAALKLAAKSVQPSDLHVIRDAIAKAESLAP